MPARICPDCGRPHNHTAKKCTTCYQSRHYRRGRRNARPTAVPPICAPGLCNNPATEARLVVVGMTEGRGTSDTGWLFLCPSCAALFDEENARTINPVIIPAQTAVRGHRYC